MFPSKFLQFPSILTHFHAANEKIQNGGRDLTISRGLVWVKVCFELVSNICLNNYRYHVICSILSYQFQESELRACVVLCITC